MNIKRLGDPHLGRRFVNNVPLHRRGDRERMVNEQFVRELDPKGADYHVCMGDLFDSTDVSNETILHAALSYIKAAKAHPNTEFIVLRGNHDGGRDLTKITAWDIFVVMVSFTKNITVVQNDTIVRGDTVFFGWSASKTAEDIVNDATFENCTTAYGHWDVDLRTHHHNLVPTKPLAERGITKIFTGHVHLADQFTRDGIAVTVVGSMVGYAHGEGLPYVTLTPTQLKTTDVTNLCVRLRIEDDEELPDIPDCLQWQVDWVKVDKELDITVSLEGFDLNKTYAATMGNKAIEPEVRKVIDERWQATFTKQA